jgi:hypothetical protein
MPIAINSIINDNARGTKKPQTLGIDKSRWRGAFPDDDGSKFSSGLYVFWWKGTAGSLPKNTSHWVKGKQKGDNDPAEKELGGTATYFKNKPDDETAEKKTKEYLHYRGTWTFHPVVVDDEVFVPLYVGKSTNVSKRIGQHLSWSAGFASNYVIPAKQKKKSELQKTKKGDLYVIPRYNTASQLSDHFHFLFRDKPDLGQALKKEKIHLSVCFTDFADYESRFFYEDRLIGELRPPFNLDSER